LGRYSDSIKLPIWAKREASVILKITLFEPKLHKLPKLVQNRPIRSHWTNEMLFYFKISFSSQERRQVLAFGYQNEKHSKTRFGCSLQVRVCV